MSTDESEFENLIRSLRFDDAPDPAHRDELEKQLLSALRTQTHRRAHLRPRMWRTIMKSRTARLAAAACIVLGIGAAVALVTIGNGGATIAWAEVQEQLRAFRPYACTFTTQYEGRPALTKRILRLSLTRRREILPNGHIHVYDLSQSPVRTLSLYPERKEAIETTLIGTGPAKDPDLLDMVAALREGSVEDQGTQDMRGRKIRRFHLPNKINDFTVSVDVETKLPVCIELRQPRLGRKIIMDAFDFEVDFDESLFSTTAPAGYSVQKVERTAFTPTEQDLVDGLRAVASFLDGEFPPVLERGALRSRIKEYLEENNIPEEEKTEELLALGKQLERVLGYVALLENYRNVRDFTYAGEGVKLGDASTPIMWWQPRESKTYRVVYGDLTVKEVKEEDLPTTSARTR